MLDLLGGSGETSVIGESRPNGSTVPSPGTSSIHPEFPGSLCILLSVALREAGPTESGEAGRLAGQLLACLEAAVHFSPGRAPGMQVRGSFDLPISSLVGSTAPPPPAAGPSGRTELSLRLQQSRTALAKTTWALCGATGTGGSWLQSLAASPLLGAGSEACAPGLRVLLHLLRSSADLCDQAARQGLPARLVALVETKTGPLALAVLTAMARGLQSLLLSGSVAPSAASVQALEQICTGTGSSSSSRGSQLESLAQLLQVAGSDDALTSSCSLAISALLGLRSAAHAARAPDSGSTGSSLQSSSASMEPPAADVSGPGAPPPPTFLYEAPKLMALRRLLTSYQARASSQPFLPAFASVEGLPAVIGLADGPVAMVSELLSGPGGADVARAIAQAGILSCLTDMLPGRWPVASELSPDGVCQLVAALGRLMVAEEGPGPRLLLCPGLFDSLVALLGSSYLARCVAGGLCGVRGWLECLSPWPRAAGP